MDNEQLEMKNTKPRDAAVVLMGMIGSVGCLLENIREIFDETKEENLLCYKEFGRVLDILAQVHDEGTQIMTKIQKEIGY